MPSALPNDTCNASEPKPQPPTALDRDYNCDKNLQVALHTEGCTGLAAVPEWPPLDFAEVQYRTWHAKIVEHLEACRHLWEGTPSDPDVRPGERAAEHVSALLASERAGIWVSATHPSHDEASGESSGPRWYASLIEAASTPSSGCVDEQGRLPPVPPQLAELLWPSDGDEAAPWLSELGWTICPPHSKPQAVHADIVASHPGLDHAVWARQPSAGRFHHIAWKPGRSHCPTTEVVRGAFVDECDDEDWQAPLERMCVAACVVFDSEVLHRGAASGEAWSATLTAQLISTSGWPALRKEGRCDPKLLLYTLPICQSPKPARRTRKLKSSSASSPTKRPRLHAAMEPRGVKECALHTQLSAEGWVPLEAGLPAAWAAWPVIEFVERMHETHAQRVEESIGAHLNTCGVWLGRHGEEAAERASLALAPLGIAVYTPPPSQSQQPPYAQSGPRFYVSITEAARRHFGGVAPPMPPSLRETLWPHEPDLHGEAKMRGLGWALAPGGADPQSLHADLWGENEPKRGRVRFPHLLWKRPPGEFCSTQVVPRGFTNGASVSADYSRLVSAKARALLLDSECLHRGAATGAAAWVSSCSIELCSYSGWEAWNYGTGGTVADLDDPAWEMLPIAGSP